MAHAIALLTIDHVPNHRITKMFDVLVASTFVPMSTYETGVKSLDKGKVDREKLTAHMLAAHKATLDALREAAFGLGANAVVGVRLGQRDISSSLLELYAYGTPVRYAS